MIYVKWTFWILLIVIVGGFLHYTLPQRDIVRIVNTEVRRVDVNENSWFWAQTDVGNDPTTVNRDVRFIETIRPNGKPRVYRNEDTGWGWPPYFKLDSSNLQAEASDLISNRDAPRWVALRHYGWRNEFLSIFPNAVGVRQVDGPDTRLIPWLNISILVFLTLIILVIWRMLAQFRERSIDPFVADAGEAWDRVDGYADRKRDRFRRWLNTWKKK
ncbi:DUF1523 family protein [Oceaniglobus ichthyenteri]|uniref:DUF1523 family protein n=1 Tax=Oceaniglobus ichthyenteri TaxID=2136177 RepID=UPI000D35651D|nr:DUF1523 family protein [Oceaniglobus ichthyenteri]